MAENKTPTTPKTQGVLPSQKIQAMIKSGKICLDIPLTPNQIQPASLDLRLGTKAYRVNASFLASKKHTVEDRLKQFQMHEIDLETSAVLEKNCVYLVPLMESLNLPPSVSAVANAKSSTGRVDLMTRCITDYGVEFDRIIAGYKGPLYAEICPRAFPVRVRTGMRLNQVRFHKNGQSIVTDKELNELHETDRLVNTRAHIDKGLRFSVDLDNKLVGYRARPHTGVIDLDRINHYAIEDYWEPVYAENKRIILDPGAFYILASREAVHIPPAYAAEMAPYQAMVGEFRVHYAGFFDPGFGHSATGGDGSRGVLEVRCHEAPFILEHGQTVGRLLYERMTEPPNILYGGGEIASNYQGQKLKLSKHFLSKHFQADPQSPEPDLLEWKPASKPKRKKKAD